MSGVRQAQGLGFGAETTVYDADGQNREEDCRGTRVEGF
jgi:hypothetical protein